MTTEQRLEFAAKLLGRRTDLQPETRAVFNARIDSARVLLAERDALDNALIRTYRGEIDSPLDGRLANVIESAYKLQRVENSLNFILDMLGGDKL